jgi:LPXTG-motif cell wall-anchored protein
MYNDYGTDVRVVAGSPSYVVAVLTPVSGPGSYGTIIATSNPAGANVYLDGMDKGSSPATITNVSSGLHTVSFTKTGYTSASRSITMTAGQTMQITVDLTKTCRDWGDWLNTTTLIFIGIIVLILIIIGVLLRKKKNRWDNY